MNHSTLPPPGPPPSGPLPPIPQAADVRGDNADSAFSSSQLPTSVALNVAPNVVASPFMPTNVSRDLPYAVRNNPFVTQEEALDPAFDIARTAHVADLQCTIGTLEARVAELTEQLAQANRGRPQRNSDEDLKSNLLKTQNAELQSLLERKDEEIKDLREKKITADKERAEKDAIICELGKEIQTLNIRIGYMEVSSLEAARHFQEEIDSLTEEKNLREAKIAESQRNIDALIKEIAELRKAEAERASSENTPKPKKSGFFRN